MTDESERFGRPIDLAGEADFVLGGLRISPSTREIARGDLREMLEPRVMQVLVALFQADGRVVSRDELIARCWDGRIVGEDAINRVIGRLRRLSETDGAASFAVETIPRVGYRLLAKATAAMPPPLAAPEPPEPPPPTAPELPQPPQPPVSAPRRSLFFRHRLALGMAVLLIAAAATAWLLWPQPRWTVDSSRPFLSTLSLEQYPSFSPNGSMMAYASGPDLASRQIYVRNVAGGEGIRISHDEYADIWPTWSSDGARLAYIAQKKDEPCRIMVATVPAGETREAGRCASAPTSPIAWQPGTSQVYYSEHIGLKGYTIYRLDVDSGARQILVQEPEMRDIVGNLHCSPDGKWLAYLILNDSVVIRDIASGRERILGQIAQRGDWTTSLTWADDSQSVMASRSLGIGSEILDFPLDGGKPYRVYATALNVGHIAAGGGLLAVETDTGRSNLARASATPAAQPDIIDPANGHTWSPTFAPDGTLAFLSNRSGSNAIWTIKPGVAPALLFDGGMTSLYTIQFSPDGSLLALAIETPDVVTLKTLTAKGAAVSSFSDMKAKGLGMPSWSLDGKSIFQFERKDKRTWRIPLDNPARRVPFAPPHWVGIAMRKEGTFATRADKPGIWRIDSAVITQLTDKYPAFYDAPMAFRGDDVLVPDYDVDGPPRIWAQPLAGGPAKIIAYAPGATNQAGFQSAFAVNPKTGDIIYDAAVAPDTNIDLLTLAKR